jgi:very-short-patch-repair endonuclease
VPLLGYEADFLWRRDRLVVAVDSSYHDSPRARESDARRDAELLAAGYVVIRVRDGDMRARGRVLAARIRRRLHRCSG